MIIKIMIYLSHSVK